MKLELRQAVLSDVDDLMALGAAHAGFSVSEKIRFYERDELIEWISKPDENILLAAVVDGRIAGFLFTKIMSWHWAMLDNFYLHPAQRGKQIGQRLLEELFKQLRARKIQYVSTLISTEEPELIAYFRRQNFDAGKSYVWCDRFLSDKE